MKHLILIITIALLTGFTVDAQRGNGEGRQKIKEWKIAYITDELDLSEEESQLFWPIYNARAKELKTLRSSRKKRGEVDMEALTEAEAEALVNEHLASKTAELEILKKYVAKFRTAISYKKMVLLPKVETKFKRIILEKMRGERRGGFR